MRSLIIAICLVCAIAVVGCGSGSSSDSSSSSSSTSASESTSASAKSGKSSESESAEGSKTSAKPPTKPPTNIEIPVGLPKGKLAHQDLIVGSGATAKTGDEVTVQYVGVGFKTRKEFDSSWKRGEPLSFELGSGTVVAGWEHGIPGMKVGGRRELLVPAKLGYGSEGSANVAPNEAMVFVIDLQAVE